MVTCSLADLPHLVMHCHVLYNLPYPSCAMSRGQELEHSNLKPGAEHVRQTPSTEIQPQTLSLLLLGCISSLTC